MPQDHDGVCSWCEMKCTWCVDCPNRSFSFSAALSIHDKLVCKTETNHSEFSATSSADSTSAAGGTGANASAVSESLTTLRTPKATSTAASTTPSTTPSTPTSTTTMRTFTTTDHVTTGTLASEAGYAASSTLDIQAVSRTWTETTSTSSIVQGSTPFASSTLAYVTDISSELAQLHKIEDREDSMLLATLSGNTTMAADLPDGSTMLAQRLTSEALSSRSFEMSVGPKNQSIKIRLPESFLEAVDGDGALVVTILAETEPGTRAAVRIRAASSRSQGWVSVEGLEEPMQFTLPVEAKSSRCAYWDEEKEKWSDEGVKTLGADSEGMLVCSSIHLTLFAAIVEGFVSTLLCTKITLFSSEGLVNIFRGNWFQRTDAVLLWLVMLFEFCLLILAAYLDMRRRREGLWTDEHFLTCNANYVRQSSVAVGRQDVTNSPPKRSGTLAMVRSTTGALQGAGVAASGGLCSSAKETFMNFIDALGSPFYSSFGYLRNFLVCAYEAFCEMVSNEQPRSRLAVVLSRLVAASVEYQACAALWLSRQDVRFLAEERKSHLADEESGSLTPAAKRMFGQYRRTPTAAWQDSFGHTSSAAIDHISSLHQAVGEGLDEQHSKLAKQHCLAFPTTAWMLFQSQAPWLNILHSSMFMPASLGALLLMCRTFGALAITALFFQETSASSADSSQEVCGTEGTWESLGQCLAIGLISVLLAAIPEAWFSKLHQREFMHFDSEDMPERKQLLQSWRRQDLCLWTLCSAYIGFCLLFVIAFLANVMPEDAISWKVGGLIELFTELLFVPMALTLFFVAVTGMTAHWKEVVEESGKHIGFRAERSQISSAKAADTPNKALAALPGLLTSNSGVKAAASDSFSGVNSAVERSTSIQSNQSDFLQ